MFHLNFMSNLLNFCYIVYNEESQKASVGSRSSLPSSNNFFFSGQNCLLQLSSHSHFVMMMMMMMMMMVMMMMMMMMAVVVVIGMATETQRNVSNFYRLTLA